MSERLDRTLLLWYDRTRTEVERKASKVHQEPWCSGLTCLPVTQKIAGSNPVGSALSRERNKRTALYFFALLYWLIRPATEIYDVSVGCVAMTPILAMLSQILVIVGLSFVFHVEGVDLPDVMETIPHRG